MPRKMPWIINKEDLFQQQAPLFNFELNADQLLEKALERGFVRFYKKIDSVDYYLINQDYGKEVQE